MLFKEYYVIHTTHGIDYNTNNYLERYFFQDPSWSCHIPSPSHAKVTRWTRLSNLAIKWIFRGKCTTLADNIFCTNMANWRHFHVFLRLNEDFVLHLRNIVYHLMNLPFIAIVFRVTWQVSSFKKKNIRFILIPHIIPKSQY